MSKFLFVLLSFSFLNLAIAQNKLPEFGKADISELKMQNCEFDKNASAVKLLDEEQVEFFMDTYDGAIKVRTQRHMRIKIFNENGFAFANIVIPYFEGSNTSKVTDIQAIIYNIDDQGKVTTEDVSKSDIFKDKSKNKESLNTIRFTFPHLQQGSVIEYQYTKIDKNTLQIEPWFFQAQIPVITSMCTLIAPAGFQLNIHAIATQTLIKDSIPLPKDKYVTSRLTMYDVPSFRAEPFMTSLRDNLQHLEFSVLPTSGSSFIFNTADSKWTFINYILLHHPKFGQQLFEVIDSTQSLLDSIKKISLSSEKIGAVFNLVKSNVKWNNIQTLYPDDINACWKNKSGNSADINLLMINFLRRAGIPCYPLLISTRDNGLTDQGFANLGQFNGIDVFLKDSLKNYFIDATQKNTNYTVPAFNVLNRLGFKVSNSNYGWVNIIDNDFLMNSSFNVNAEVDSNGILNGNAEGIFYDYSKAERIEEENESSIKREQREKDMLQQNDALLIVDSSTYVNKDDDTKPLINKIKFHSNLSSTDNTFFINPFLFSAFRKNPFTDSIRRSDIDFGCNQKYTTNIHIQLPANFSIEEMPKEITIRTEDTSIFFESEFFSSGSEIVVRNTFEINNPIFLKEQYFGVKDFFDKLYSIINHDIILKKER